MDKHHYEFTNEELYETVNSFIDRGLIEMSWDDEKNDFVLSITEEGLKQSNWEEINDA